MSVSSLRNTSRIDFQHLFFMRYFTWKNELTGRKFGKLKTWFGQYYIRIVLIEAWNFKIGFAIHISESIRGKPKCLEKELSSSQYSKANSTNSMVYQDIFMACQPRYWNTVKLISELIVFLLILCNKKGFINVLLVPAKYYRFICKPSPCRTQQACMQVKQGNPG